jgi:protein TonB
MYQLIQTGAIMKSLVNTARFALYGCLAAVLFACSAEKEVRTYEDIQAVLDQHRPEMLEIYRGFLAVRSDLGGRTTFEITIEPSGQASNCKVVHSDVSEPKFGEALCVRILDLDFGRKNMDAVTITHWLDFYG